MTSPRKLATLWGVQTTLLVGYLLVFLLFLGMGYRVFNSYTAIQKAIAERGETSREQLLLERLLSRLESAESHQRSYVFLQFPVYRQLYKNDIDQTFKDIAQLQPLLNDEPVEQAEFTRLHSLFNAQIQAMQHTIELTMTGHPDEAKALLKSHHSRALMDQIQPLISRLQMQENLLWESYSRQIHTEMRSTMTLGSFTAALILAIFIGLFYSLRYEMKRRQTAEALANMALEQESLSRQDAENANRQKTRLLSYVAHDFKTPLNAIQWILDALMSDNTANLTPDQRQALTNVGIGATQLRLMVNDMLEKTRLESGNVKPRFALVRVPEMLDNVAILMQPMARENGVTLHYHTDPQLTTIEADPVQLRQILLNLISNALKYNRRGGQVSVFSSLLASRLVEFRIQDTGIGIPANQLSEIFSPYFRSNTCPTGVEGTGLGLAFVKKLVQLHGGDITVESTPGQGSTFTVVLPLGTVETKNPTDAMTACPQRESLVQ